MYKIMITGLLITLTGTSFAASLGPTRTGAGGVKIDENKPFRLEGEVGYLLNDTESTNGTSTKKSNLTGRILFQRQAGIWGQEILANAISTNDDTATNNIERYLIAGKLSRSSSDTVYQFGKLTAEKDLSSAFDYQISATGGIGANFIKTDKQSLSAEAGLGYRFSKERVEPKETNNEIIGTLAAFYEYRFNAAVRFNQDLGYEFGQDSQIFRSRTALTTDLTKHFAASASYNIRDVQADAGNSRDSLLSLGVNYKY
ncbi:hypothetical protein GCM10027155_10590 [Acinetobacter apis]|uniref:Putative salt-induced outer membrane protein YdiY n=1 Tax=Acinetobacter apis TaxID=1229165 RepID=A0A217EFL6_9GAMM|nr:DUF481 domain-containing protein [Acinetobacter apis]SNQ29137.1 Putative salt-induced outer membrane protein YdiY [Acinetobacter apis]